MVDINCDAGESFGAFRMGDDEAVMNYATSVSIACGFHGGDPRTIETTIRRARDLGVAVGAHPSFPDMVGFGRRSMKLSADEVRTDVLYQIGAVDAIARANGVRLRHVKPHGALNNMAFMDEPYARAIVEAVSSFDLKLVVIAYGGKLLEIAQDSELPVALEAYADRAYTSDGALLPRSHPGAVIHDPVAIAERAVQMVLNSEVVATTGDVVRMHADTICIHSDTPGAGDIARHVRHDLERAGAVVRPLARASPEMS